MEPIGNHIQIGEQIGEGGSGMVYSCQNENGRQMAVKEIKNGPIGIAHLLEPILMTTLYHPSINRALKVHVKPDMLYLIQNFAIGDLLSLSKEGPDALSPELKTDSLMKEWIFSICDGIHFLHNHQIVHGDIKASNILLFDDLSVKITDFSSSVLLADHTPRSHRIGTLNHSAPEILQNQQWSYPIDIWALGCTIHQIIYGSPMFPSPKLQSRRSRGRSRNRHIERMKMLQHIYEWFTLNVEESTANPNTGGVNLRSGEGNGNKISSGREFTITPGPQFSGASPWSTRSRTPSRSPSHSSSSETSDYEEDIYVQVTPAKFLQEDPKKPQWNSYRSLIRSILQYNPSQRPTIADVILRIQFPLIPPDSSVPSVHGSVHGSIGGVQSTKSRISDNTVTGTGGLSGFIDSFTEQIFGKGCVEGCAQSLPQTPLENGIQSNGKFQKYASLPCSQNPSESPQRLQTIDDFTLNVPGTGTFQRLQTVMMRKDRTDAVLRDLQRFTTDSFLLQTTLNIYSQPSLAHIESYQRLMTSLWMMTKMMGQRVTLLERIEESIPLHTLLQTERVICERLQFCLL